MSYIWRNRTASSEEPAEAADEAEASAASSRLRRVVGRVEQVEAPSAAEEREPGRFADSALRRNAFSLLGLAIDADAGAINEAFDALSFEPDSDPDALNVARAKLMSARDRLGEELGWLPEMSPDLLASVRGSLAAGDCEALAAARDATIGMARLNLGLALCQAFPDDAERAARALADGQALEADPLFDRLNEARARGGFRAIERENFDQALAEKGRAAAQALAPVFAGTTSARNLLTRTLQAGDSALAGFAPAFVDALLRVYAGEIDAALEQARSRIARAAEALRAEPSDHRQANALAASLDLWSNLRRPVQVHEAARGLDDPASAEIFEEVRKLVVGLSNDHEEYEIALRLARTLVSSFALVPFHRAALQRELPVLIANALSRQLSRLCDAARADHSAFARSVNAGGLVRGGGPAGQLAAAFADAVETTPESRDSYFWIVRNLAIDLNNQHRERRCAVAMTHWLAALNPPEEVRAQLDQDLARLGVAPAAPAAGPEGDDGPPPVFGRAGRSAPGSGAPPRAPPPPPAPGLAPSPALRPERNRGRRRMPAGVQLFLLAFFAISYCSTRPTRVARAPEPAEPVIAGPKPSYRTAPASGRDRYEQRLREIEIRAANERLRRLDPAARPVGATR